MDHLRRKNGGCRAMIKVTVYLKSGQTVMFKCMSATFEFSNTTLEFTGYEFTGLQNYKKVSFVPSQIAAYTTI